MHPIRRFLPWFLAIYIAFVFIQSLFFKFSGAAESIHIFSTIGAWLGLAWFEPVGRYATGLTELVASILLLIPLLRPLGALLALVTMTGAIFFHLFSPLGVEVAGDGGLLFTLACGVWLSALLILLLQPEANRRLHARLRRIA